MKNKKNYISFHASNINQLISDIDIDKSLVFYSLVIYYILTIINSLLEATNMILIVSVFTLISTGINNIELPIWINQIVGLQGVKFENQSIFHLLVIFLGLNLITRAALLIFDGVSNAKLRQKLQETIFRKFLLGQWTLTKNFRLGDAVGTNTQEAMIAAKYLSSAIIAFYFLLSASVMITLAIISSPKLVFFSCFIAIPFAVIVKIVFYVQEQLSRKSALLRNQFSADISDRFNGLLQIHVDNNYDYHINRGVRKQNILTQIDIRIAFCQAFIGSFNILLPFFIMVSISLWFYFMGSKNIPELVGISSVGILTYRAASQLHGAVASFGNLSRLSGSLFPVLNILAIKPIKNRILIQEDIISLELKKVTFKYKSHQIFNDVSFIVKKGIPFLLTGRSGTGKTTLANLIAGLFDLNSGKIIYHSDSGKSYLSNAYKANIGFVTQDIYLFQGTIRSNLVGDRKCSDEEIWSVLKQVDVAHFVKKIGGLNSLTSEAGRMISGGQKRRLGIARALLSGCNILIFDEILAGLDLKNKIAISKLINKLKLKIILIIISHEKLFFDKYHTYNLDHKRFL